MSLHNQTIKRYQLFKTLFFYFTLGFPWKRNALKCIQSLIPQFQRTILETFITNVSLKKEIFLKTQDSVLVAEASCCEERNYYLKITVLTARPIFQIMS